MLDFNVLLETFLEILSVVPKTLGIAATAFLLSALLGAIMAIIQQYKVPILTQIISLYKLFLRGTPMVVFIYIMYYALPSITALILSLVRIEYNPDNMQPVAILIIALTLTLSSFQTEIIRGAFSSVEYSQIQAAQSLGYSFFHTFWRVIFPQAMVEAIPDFANSFTVVLKATSLGFLITVVDIFAKAKIMAALNFHYLEAFLMAAFIYWILGSFITKFSDRIEKRVRVY